MNKATAATTAARARLSLVFINVPPKQIILRRRRLGAIVRRKPAGAGRGRLPRRIPNPRLWGQGDLVGLLQAGLLNTYTYIIDIRRRKMPCAVNFFSRRFAARMESPDAHVINWQPL